MPTLSIPDGWVKQLTTGTQGNGLSEIARAKQWIKIPAQATLAENENARIDYPTDDPQGRQRSDPSTANLFLSSPKGAKDGYGVGLPTTVRTVAFGAVPIQAGLQLEQLRDSDDLPVPLKLNLSWIIYRQPHQVRPGFSSQQEYGAELTGKVRVRGTAPT